MPETCLSSLLLSHRRFLCAHRYDDNVSQCMWGVELGLPQPLSVVALQMPAPCLLLQDVQQVNLSISFRLLVCSCKTAIVT